MEEEGRTFMQFGEVAPTFVEREGGRGRKRGRKRGREEGRGGREGGRGGREKGRESNQSVLQ